MKKLAKQDAASMPWLKSAPYCIDISAANGGVVLCEARTDVPCSTISLNGALAAPFSMTSGKLQLPPWYQVSYSTSVAHGNTSNSGRTCATKGLLAARFVIVHTACMLAADLTQ
jgi:hypothetical protein